MDESGGWLNDAEALNNIALGWASLFRSPSATIQPTPTGQYQVLPYPVNQPAPAVSYQAGTLGISPGVLLVLAVAGVAVAFALAR